MSDSGNTLSRPEDGLSYRDLEIELEKERDERSRAMKAFGFETEPARAPWWQIVKQELDKIEQQNEQLRKENEDLRQQIRDITAHPIGTYRGPIAFCSSCGDPTYSLLNHVCKR